MKRISIFSLFLFINFSIYAQDITGDSDGLTRATRPGAPAVTSPISVVVPSLDLGAVLQALANINCKIGNVNQPVCDDTILSVLGDACTILGISISEALSILLDCCESDTLDVTGVFTVLQDIQDTLTNCGMPMHITQAMIPYTITQPGLYCLAEDVTPTGGGQTLITINVSNVVLDLNEHQLIGGNTGIGTAGNLSNITIKNGILRSQSLRGMFLRDQNVIIEDVSFYNVPLSNIAATASAIILSGVALGTLSKDVIIRNCNFFQGFAHAILMTTQPASRIVIQGCNFLGSAPSGSSLDFIFADIVTGFHTDIVIDSCVFQENIFQAIACISLNTAFKVSIQNCILENVPTALSLATTTSVIDVKNCIINDTLDVAIIVDGVDVNIQDTHISRSNSASGAAAIVLSNFANNIIIQGSSIKSSLTDGIDVSCSNVQIADTSVMNNGGFGILASSLIDDLRNIVIKNCVAQNNIFGGISIGNAIGSIIDNCEIAGNGIDGIDLLTTSSAIIITECNITGNQTNGINCTTGFNTLVQNITSGNFGGAGILFSIASNNNYAHTNTAIGNGTFGIENNGTNNKIYRNYAALNGSGDYTGVTPVNTPGGALTGTFDDFIANVAN